MHGAYINTRTGKSSCCLGKNRNYKHSTIPLCCTCWIQNVQVIWFTTHLWKAKHNNFTSVLCCKDILVFMGIYKLNLPHFQIDGNSGPHCCEGMFLFRSQAFYSRCKSFWINIFIYHSLKSSIGINKMIDERYQQKKSEHDEYIEWPIQIHHKLQQSLQISETSFPYSQLYKMHPEIYTRFSHLPLNNFIFQYVCVCVSDPQVSVKTFLHSTDTILYFLCNKLTPSKLTRGSKDLLVLKKKINRNLDFICISVQNS